MKDYRHVLLAADASQPAEELVARAADLARRFSAQLTCLYVLEHFPEEIPMTWASLEETDPKTGLILRARERLANLMNQTGYPDARCEAVPSMYSAKYEILRFAKEHQADLIVVGSHARRGLERLLGSTAAGVVHGAGCDVLTVHVGE